MIDTTMDLCSPFPSGNRATVHPPPRQIEVASWLAQGRSNEEIAKILNVGIDKVKAHVKALYERIGSDGRLATAIIAHTTPPFSALPPLWKLNEDAWGASGGQGG